MPSKRDMAEMYSKAIRNGWEIPSDMKDGVIAELMDIIQGQGVHVRDKIRAVEALTKIDGLNVQRENADKSLMISVNASSRPVDEISAEENDAIVAELTALPRPNQDY